MELLHCPVLLSYYVILYLHCFVSSVDEDDDDDADEAVDVRGTTAGGRVELQQQQNAAGPSANQLPLLSPVQPAGAQLLAPPSQRPSEAPPTTTAQAKSPAPSSTSQAPPPLPLPTASSATQV